MRTDRLVSLSHTGPALSQGRACLVFLPGGGILTDDWVALVHRDGWGIPAGLDLRFVELAKAAGATGIEIGCRLRRRPDIKPPDPPVFDIVDEYDDGGMCLLGDPPNGRALFAGKRLRRSNALAHIYYTARDPFFRKRALRLLRRFGLGALPDLRVLKADGKALAKPGSWVDEVLREAHEVIMSGQPATECSAELYWLLQAIPRYDSSGRIEPTPAEGGDTTDTE